MLFSMLFHRGIKDHTDTMMWALDSAIAEDGIVLGSHQRAMARQVRLRGSLAERKAGRRRLLHS